MAIWLVRGGKYGEYEDRFFSDNKIYLTWDNLSASLSGLADRAALRLLLDQTYPNQAAARIRNWVGQIGRFVFNMSVGDIVVVPKKGKIGRAHV